MRHQIVCCLAISALLAGAAQAQQQWQPSLASVASLRTGGASLVSSDSIRLDHGQLALITYWEARTASDLDVYRCIDVTGPGFEAVSQECWRALRPTGRAPTVVDRVTSSADLCGAPSVASPFSEVAFCGFTAPFEVRTPYFSLMLTSFEDGGLVAARDGGRSVLVAADALPSSTFFEVQAISQEEFAVLYGLTIPDDLIARPPDGFRCSPEQIAARQWISCRGADVALSEIRHHLAEGIVYSVAFHAESSPSDERSIDLMFDSLRLGSAR